MSNQGGKIMTLLLIVAVMSAYAVYRLCGPRPNWLSWSLSLPWFVVEFFGSWLLIINMMPTMNPGWHLTIWAGFLCLAAPVSILEFKVSLALFRSKMKQRLDEFDPPSGGHGSLHTQAVRHLLDAGKDRVSLLEMIDAKAAVALAQRR